VSAKDRRSYTVVGTIAAVSNGNGQIATMGQGEKAERTGDFYFLVEDSVLKVVAKTFRVPFDKKNTILRFRDRRVQVTGVIEYGRFGPMIRVRSADQLAPDDGRPVHGAAGGATREFDVTTDMDELDKLARSGTGQVCAVIGTIAESRHVVSNWYFRLEGGGSWVYVTMSREQADAIARKLRVSHPARLIGTRIRIEAPVTIHDTHGVPWLRAITESQVDLPERAGVRVATGRAVEATDGESLRQAAEDATGLDLLVRGEVESVFWDGANKRLRMFFDKKQFIVFVDADVVEPLRETYGKGLAGLTGKTVEMRGPMMMYRDRIPSLTITELDGLRIVD
jgi:hypothetical protein